MWFLEDFAATDIKELKNIKFQALNVVKSINSTITQLQGLKPLAFNYFFEFFTICYKKIYFYYLII